MKSTGLSWRLGVIAAQLFLAAGAMAAELRVGLSADVTTMDPHYIAAQPNLTVQHHVFEPLLHVDERGRSIPVLATWRNPDPLTWEFTLKKGVKFHDGSELTAEDVAFSLERPLTAGTPGGFATYVKPIVAKEIVDRYTIRLKTATPHGAVPQDLAEVMIISKKVAQGAASSDFDSGKAAIGTGPYKLTRFTRGSRVELARNDQDWGGKTPWDKVTLTILPSDPVRTAALLSGDVDAIENVPTADLARLKKNPAFRLEQAVSWRTIFLHVDQAREQPPGVLSKSGKPLDKNPLMDPRVRRALSKAINRQAIAERVMEGLAMPAANVVSPSMFGHNPAIKPEAYDPEGAKKLLAEAGYPDGFALTIGTPNNRYINDDQVAQTVAQLWSRIGVTTKIEAMPLSVYFGKARNKEFGVALLGWGSLAADMALRSLAATANPDKGHGAWNWGGYSNPKLDQMIERSLATVDPAKREAAAREAAAFAASENAIIPLHYQIVTWAMKSNLSYAARTDEFTFAWQFKPRGAVTK